MTHDIKPTLLFIHGAGGSVSSWSFLKRELKKEYLNIEAFNLPGHGNAEGNGYNTIEGYVNFVEEYIFTRKISNFYIAGHSMGGAIALEYALTNQNFVKGLILIGTGARLKVNPAILSGITTDFEKSVKMIVENSYFNKNHLTQGIDEMLKNKPEVLFNDFAACNDFDVTKKLQEITIPALILCGRADVMTPPKYSAFLAENIKNSELHIIEDSGHMLMIENPSNLAYHIREFIKK